MKNPVDFHANNPISIAVAPIKKDAVERAEKNAGELINRLRAALAEVGNDINIYAPEPRSDMGREAYKTAQRKRGQIKMLTNTVKSAENDWRNRHPKIVEFCDKKIADFIKMSREQAALQYDAFVAKLCNKIGDTTSATLEGNHVWGYSFLTVVLPSGEKQIWKTQQIVNCSVLGLLFNQWPSRKMKGGK